MKASPCIYLHPSSYHITFKYYENYHFMSPTTHFDKNKMNNKDMNPILSSGLTSTQLDIMVSMITHDPP